MEDTLETRNFTNETKWSKNPFINRQLRVLEKRIKASQPTSEFFDPKKSQTVRGEPNIYSQSIFALKDIIGSFGFDALDQASKKVVVERLNELEQQMLEKLFEYDPRQKTWDKNYQKRFNTERWMENYEEKRQRAKDLLASGKYFGHGTYLADLVSIAKEGMLAPIHLASRQGKQLAEVGRFNNGHPDTSYVFFTPFNAEGISLIPAGVYSGGTTQGSKNWREPTDLAIYYPSEVFIEAGSTIRFDGAEVAVSGADLSKVSHGWLTANEHDPIRRLPLRSAYIICPIEKLEEMTTTLKDSGYNDDWLNEHLMALNPKNESRSISQGGMYDRVRTNLGIINDWLQSRNKPVHDEKVLIEIQDHKAGSSHLYFTAQYQHRHNPIISP